MMRDVISGSLAIAAALVGAVGVAGTDIAPIDASPSRNPSSFDPGWERVGTLKPRSVRETGRGCWMLDGGTQDRDFVDFDEYSQYLEALGIRELRLLAGWAKTEKQKGVYDFAWLDHQIDWCRAHGIDVYLDISYGNPIYPGAVYAVPEKMQIVHSKGITFARLPLYDSPCLLTERAAVCK